MTFVNIVLNNIIQHTGKLSQWLNVTAVILNVVRV